MTFPSVPQLLWNARRYANLIGFGGIGAILVLLACAVWVLAVLRPAQSELVQIQREVEVLRLQSGATGQRANMKAVGPADQLSEFYQRFPVRASAPDAMAKLYAAAQQHNINLDHGEYRFAPGKDDSLARYEVVLPVKGPYTSIRKFVAQSLGDLPTLALDSIAFNRQRVDEPTVDVELRFTLYLSAK